MAAAIMTTKMVASLESSKFGAGAGNHESAMPALPKPTKAPAIGVRNPIRSEPPLAIAIKPIIQVPNVGVPGATR